MSSKTMEYLTVAQLRGLTVEAQKDLTRVLIVCFFLHLVLDEYALKTWVLPKLSTTGFKWQYYAEVASNMQRRLQRDCFGNPDLIGYSRT
jgi:hypothetical protein